jgi:transcription elongation factor GreA
MAQVTYDWLKTKLDGLLEERVSLAEELASLGHGDDADRAQSTMRREDLVRLDGQIAGLREQLNNVEITSTPVSADRVALGTVVALCFDGDNTPERYLISNDDEQADGVTTVSESSPLGSALLGATPGATVSYRAPAGTFRVRVAAVSAA